MRKQSKRTEKELKNWRLIERFLEVLEDVASKQQMHPTFGESRRTLGYGPYLSLFLLGIFNPVVQSMRQLCAVTELDKVQRTAGCGKVSLGSFSETQAVLEPDLLKQVFERLVEEMPMSPKADPQLKHLALIAQDGSLWRALPRMAWAEYGVGPKGVAKGVRLHMRFNILKDCPEDALVTDGKASETEAMKELLVPGQTTVGDRLYGQNYKLFHTIDQAKAFFVFRLSEQASIHFEEELPVSASDAQAGVVRHAWVHLGATDKLRSIRLRLVEIKKEGKRLLLATNHAEKSISPELVGLIYRRRWSVELFFRWIKCILGTRHFFAESREGVAIQMYLALIAGLLFQHFTGQRPNKRVMELLQMYILGWATAEETARLVFKYGTQTKTAKNP